MICLFCCTFLLKGGHQRIAVEIRNAERKRSSRLHTTTLKERRERLKKDTKRIAVDIRNVERKRARLRARARLLTSNDLLEVYAMRVRAAKKSEHAAAAYTA